MRLVPLLHCRLHFSRVLKAVARPCLGEGGFCRLMRNPSVPMSASSSLPNMNWQTTSLGGSSKCCLLPTGEREDFAERYLEKLLPRYADVDMHKHARHEMASAVTPVNGSAFAIVHQAIQETLAHGRVRHLLPSSTVCSGPPPEGSCLVFSAAVLSTVVTSRRAAQGHRSYCMHTLSSSQSMPLCMQE